MRAIVNWKDRSIETAVSDLVRRPSSFVRSQGLSLQAKLRAKLGQEVHRRYQGQREERYGRHFAAETSVTLQHSLDDFQAYIRGRVDGIIGTAEALVVEEVKSMAMSSQELTKITEPELVEYCAQLRIYGLALQERAEREGRALQLRLVLVSLLDKSEHLLPIEFTTEQAHADLQRYLRLAIREDQRKRARGRVRAAAAQALRFPYREARGNQEQLMQGIATGLADGRPVLARAPTGLGKTVAGLLPCLKAALENNRALMVATAKTTQRAQVAKTFEDIRSAAGPRANALSATTLRAKAAMCPPGHGKCTPEACPYIDEYGNRGRGALAASRILAGGGHISPEEIWAHGQSAMLCPYQLSLELAAEADLVIGDFNHVLPEQPLERSDETKVFVLLDEAHNLVDRARDRYSPFISHLELSEIAERLAAGHYLAAKHKPGPQLVLDQGMGRQAPQLFERLARLVDAIRSELEVAALGVKEQAGLAIDRVRWEDYANRALEGMVEVALYHRRYDVLEPADPLPNLLRRVVRIRDTLAKAEPEFVPYVAGAQARTGPGLGVLCVNPAKRLAHALQQNAGSVLMSATLTPMKYFADVLGMRALDASLVTVDSPFPPSRRCIITMPTLRTSYGERESYFGDIARAIEDIVATRRGNYMAFFPSFHFLQQVSCHLKAREGFLVQRRGMSEVERSTVLRTFQEQRGETLLLAVAGGIFAEGVDLPGTALIGSMIIGPALPPVGFERAQMRRYFDAQGGDGFAYAMLYPGMQKVIQAAGRVIRSPEDRGIIALLGQRFSTSRYQACFPAQWGQPSGDSPLATLRSFWGHEEEQGSQATVLAGAALSPAP